MAPLTNKGIIAKELLKDFKATEKVGELKRLTLVDEVQLANGLRDGSMTY